VTHRREFLKGLAGAAAGVFFSRCPWVKAAASAMQSGAGKKRREVAVGGRRVRTVDLHAHCHIPEVWDLFKDYDLGAWVKKQIDARPALQPSSAEERIRFMDEQGIDVQAAGINPFWYGAERDVAAQIVQVQNEKLAQLCSTHPDRFVALASVALQYPYLAAEQLENGMKKLGMRGCFIGGSVEGTELANPKFHPFWAKAEELGAVVFIHPQEFPDIQKRFQGNGNFQPVVGDPLETTIALSHLIFEGTLDRFPGLKICAAHGGGYLPSYIGRSDRCVENKGCKPVKKLPSEYLKQLYFDSLVFTSEGLRHLVAEAGASQIVLGTDYPYGFGSEHPVDHILSTPSLSDAERRAILGENAAKLLRLDV
jgi:aminocarboxymuconate-semialdehyde decarboxylase